MEKINLNMEISLPELLDFKLEILRNNLDANELIVGHDIKLKMLEYEKEKKILLEEIYQLKELLSQVSMVRIK